jgi:hypothetical protein
MISCVLWYRAFGDIHCEQGGRRNTFWYCFLANSQNYRSRKGCQTILAAVGFVLLFVSDQAPVLVNGPYPPLGLASISFIGLASYMILIGIYSSAISVSEDSKLRQTIRSLTAKDPKLLESIGTAHMVQEIQKRVIILTKQNQDRMAEESGIQSSLTEEDMKSYLQEVIKEIQKR